MVTISEGGVLVGVVVGSYGTRRLGREFRAFAADLRVRGPLYKSPPPVVYNSNGFYGGVNVGYSFGGGRKTTGRFGASCSPFRNPRT